MILPNTWNALQEDNLFQIRALDGQIIATVENCVEAEANAKLIAASPYMLEALLGVVGIIGDEDLPDNGELSGGAISDMVRAAIDLARK